MWTKYKRKRIPYSLCILQSQVLYKRPGSLRVMHSILLFLGLHTSQQWSWMLHLGIDGATSQFGGDCPMQSDYHGDHCCLHPSHLLELLSQSLGFLHLLMFLLSRVTINWYAYIYYYDHLLLFVHHYYVQLVSHHQFVLHYLEVPRDLCSVQSLSLAAARAWYMSDCVVPSVKFGDYGVGLFFRSWKEFLIFHYSNTLLQQKRLEFLKIIKINKQNIKLRVGDTRHWSSFYYKWCQRLFLLEGSCEHQLKIPGFFSFPFSLDLNLCVCSSNDGPNRILHSFNTSLFGCHFLHTAAAFQLYPTLNNPQVPAQSFELGRCDELMELRCVSSTSATTPKPHLATVCICVCRRVCLTGHMLLVFPLIFCLSLTLSLCVHSSV